MSKVHTFLTALCNAHMDSPTSILSPMVTGKELDLAMADATADLRKSIRGHSAASSSRDEAAFRHKNNWVKFEKCCNLSSKLRAIWRR